MTYVQYVAMRRPRNVMSNGIWPKKFMYSIFLCWLRVIIIMLIYIIIYVYGECGVGACGWSIVLCTVHVNKRPSFGWEREKDKEREGEREKKTVMTHWWTHRSTPEALRGHNACIQYLYQEIRADGRRRKRYTEYRVVMKRYWARCVSVSVTMTYAARRNFFFIYMWTWKEWWKKKKAESIVLEVFKITRAINSWRFWHAKNGHSIHRFTIVHTSRFAKNHSLLLNSFHAKLGIRNKIYYAYIWYVSCVYARLYTPPMCLHGHGRNKCESIQTRLCTSVTPAWFFVFTLEYCFTEWYFFGQGIFN